MDKTLKTIKTGCTFQVAVTKLWNYPIKGEKGERPMWMLTNPKGAKPTEELSRAMQRERDEMYVVVTSSLPKEPHNYVCTINDYQYVAQKSGIFSQKIFPAAIWMLIGTKKKKSYLTTDNMT